MLFGEKMQKIYQRNKSADSSKCPENAPFCFNFQKFSGGGPPDPPFGLRAFGARTEKVHNFISDPPHKNPGYGPGLVSQYV